MKSGEQYKERQDIERKEGELIGDKEHSHNYMRRQIQLAFELYVRSHPDANKESVNRNEVMSFWSPIDEDGQDSGLSYSKAFRCIYNNPEFKTHHRFNGDVANITLGDVEYWIKNQSLSQS